MNKDIRLRALVTLLLILLFLSLFTDIASKDQGKVNLTKFNQNLTYEPFHNLNLSEKNQAPD